MAKTEYTVLERNVRKDLERLNRQLGIVQAGIVVATAALYRQRAESDEDIARVLEHDVGRRLEEQVERLNGLIDSLQPFAHASSETGSGELERVPMQ